MPIPRKHNQLVQAMRRRENWKNKPSNFQYQQNKSPVLSGPILPLRGNILKSC